ncbi:MAG: hypothetical protein AAF587_44550, partial [Bacteroidota bacterium]
MNPEIIEQARIIEDTFQDFQVLNEADNIPSKPNPTPVASSVASQGSWCGSMSHAFEHLDNSLIQIPDSFNFGDFEYQTMKDFNLLTIYDLSNMKLPSMIRTYTATQLRNELLQRFMEKLFILKHIIWTVVPTEPELLPRDVSGSNAWLLRHALQFGENQIFTLLRQADVRQAFHNQVISVFDRILHQPLLNNHPLFDGTPPSTIAFSGSVLPMSPPSVSQRGSDPKARGEPNIPESRSEGESPRKNPTINTSPKHPAEPPGMLLTTPIATLIPPIVQAEHAQLHETSPDASILSSTKRRNIKKFGKAQDKKCGQTRKSKGVEKPRNDIGVPHVVQDAPATIPERSPSIYETNQQLLEQVNRQHHLTMQLLQGMGQMRVEPESAEKSIKSGKQKEGQGATSQEPTYAHANMNNGGGGGGDHPPDDSGSDSSGSSDDESTTSNNSSHHEQDNSTLASQHS